MSVTTDLGAGAVSIVLVSSALLALMLAAGRRVSRSAAVRHAGWVTAFALVLLLPLLLRRVSPVITYGIAVPAQPTEGRSAPSRDFGHDLLLQILGATWSTGVAALTLRYFAAAMSLGRLARRGTPIPADGRDLAEACEQLGLRRPPSVRIGATDEPAVPVTWGFLRPVVLLPRGATEWEPQRLRAVLLHELAHVRRRDNLVQALALVACALHWFNPLAWLASRRMQTDAEIACDDLVLRSGVRPSSYASELLAFAAQLNGLPGPASLLASSMAAPFTLRTRITAIVDPLADRRTVGLPRVLAAQALCAGAACCLCAVRPSAARDRPSADMARFDRHAPPLRVHSNPDVLSEEELSLLRARRTSDVRPSADLVGSADSLNYADRPGADRLPD